MAALPPRRNAAGGATRAAAVRAVPPRLKSGPSERLVASESTSRNLSAAASRGDRWVLSNAPISHSVTVAGIEACSNTRPSITVFLGIQGETSTAGTRTPSRSNRNGLLVPVAAGCATKPSGVQAGGGTWS